MRRSLKGVMQLRKKTILIDIFNVKYIETVMGHKKDIISQKKRYCQVIQ